MTDTDLDVDPALDAHLRRTFGAVTATVSESRAGDNVIRLVTAPAPHPPQRRWAWLGAAAAAGVVAGAGLMAVADRDGDVAEVPVASTVPAVVPEPDMFSLTNECAGLHERAEVWDEGASSVLFEPSAGQTTANLVAFTSDAFFTCAVSRAGDAMLNDWSTTGPTLGRPSSQAVQLLEMRAQTSTWELVGPGRILIIGRAGGAVDAVSLDLPDGSTTAAQLTGGWFFVEAEVSTGVSMIDARLTWHTSGGDVSTRRVDVLDDDTLAEACAREPGCVTAGIAQLHEAASASGRIEQATILADGTVTDAERVASLTQFADCFNAANTGATATVSGPEGVRIGTMNLDDRASVEYAQDVDQLCRAGYSAYVDDAWVLLDAEGRVEED